MEPKTAELQVAQKLKPAQWLAVVLVYCFIPLILFLCAWTLRWWQAWVFSVLIIAVGVISRVWAERRNPGLMAERVHVDRSPNVKAWDRVLSPLMSISISFPLVIVAGLDHRYGWSAVFPLWLNLLGFLLLVLGYAIATWALVENRFYSGMVRIQTDRGHVVCDKGPYRFVRHPGYAGNILPLAGMVLALSSLWTLIPAGAALIIIVVRTTLEDRTLQEELPGYREYARRVRYRLIPGIY